MRDDIYQLLGKKVSEEERADFDRWFAKVVKRPKAMFEWGKKEEEALFNKMLVSIEIGLRHGPGSLGRDI